MENTLEISENSTYTNDGYTIDKREYYSIMNDIRNMRVLTETQRAQIAKLSRKRLVEILDVYNLIMQNVNDVFS